MLKKILFLSLLLIGRIASAQNGDYFNSSYGELLAGSSDKVGLWWASSGWKINRDKSLPSEKSEAVTIRAARNEAEAAQLVVRPAVQLISFTIRAGDLSGPGGTAISSENVEVLKVRYVNVERPTDKSSVAGHWPDPLPPLKGPISLEQNKNQPFWIRIKVPQSAPAGIYTGIIELNAQDYDAKIILRVEVYDFVLPDRMTCTSAFGFSTGNVFRYQKLNRPEQRRQVLDKYWANFSAHHISPYNPAPLDRIKVTWPDIKPPARKWEGGVEVGNEKHSGLKSLLLFDDKSDLNVTAAYMLPIEIPKDGLRLRFWYRTALPEHAFLVTLNHYDASDKWIYGGNNDIGIEGSGRWQQFDRLIKTFPKGAKSIRLNLRAATWTEGGENTGMVWFDDVSLTNPVTGEE
ncbi:MAG: glycoside hydrolase domain-containing protein, partial [Planctomycetota bacterium]